MKAHIERIELLNELVEDLLDEIDHARLSDQRKDSYHERFEKINED